MIRPGKGSELLVVVRDDTPRARANAPAGLTVRTLDGRLLVDLEEVGEQSAPGEHPVWSVASVEVDPGAYRLRSRTDSIGTIEQTLVATRGWQTQVLLRRKRWGDAEHGRRASLPDASIFMAPRGHGLRPDNADARLVELARIGLLEKRVVCSRAELDRLAHGKWHDPMLGLYAIHALRMTDAPTALHQEMVANLRALLGNHPDVNALEFATGAPDGGPPVASVGGVPPMLRASWDLAVQASARRPELVPRGSLAFAIADRLFGSGVWLTWRPPPRRLAPKQAEIPALAPALEELSVAVAAANEVNVAALSPAARAAVALAGETARRPTRRPLTDEDVVETLSLPRSVAAMALTDAIVAVRRQS